MRSRPSSGGPVRGTREGRRSLRSKPLCKDIIKAFTRRYILDDLKSGKFLIGVGNVATVDALRICTYIVGVGTRVSAIGTLHIRREASALLVLLQWALPEPQVVEWAKSTDSHAFFCIMSDCESSDTKTCTSIHAMKKVLLLLAMSMLMTTAIAYSQTTKAQIKERQELAKATKKELNEKASKAARKEAKRLSKEGWKSAPGALPIEKQLDKSYMMQYQYDDEGFPKFIMAEAMSIGGNYDAAKMQALELAKQNLAGQIQTEITALIENTVANEQMDQSDATSITRSVMSAKNLISQSIGRVVPVMETYRSVNSNNREVLVRIAYSQEMAKKAAKKAIRKGLEERGDSLHNKLDELLGW